MADEQRVTLRIVLEAPPAGVDFGVQKGRGSRYETVQKQRSDKKDLHFEFSVAVKADRDGVMPVFAGPFVQGPPAGRFVYVDIGTYAGQADTPWSRRLKVPLSGITREMIDQLSRLNFTVLEARIPGTGKDGGPICATVKLPNMWKLVSSRRTP
jgi:hypothetical protein